VWLSKRQEAAWLSKGQGGCVADQDVVAALAANWPGVLAHLRPNDLRVLQESARSIRAASQDPRAARAAMADLMTVLATRLPLGHPVREAMSGRLRYAAGPGPDVNWAQVIGTLDSIPELALAGQRPTRDAPAGAEEEQPAVGQLPTARGQPAHGAPGRDGPGEDTDDWLRSAPALSEQQVRDNGCDPAEAGLIRLTGAGSQTLLPAFQFGRDGQPVPVVLTVNRLLDAESDPWGVADWWLGRNAWLRAVPAQLVGQVDDSLLVLAARAELPEG
jgi:hypothetical protein